ncbi:MAG: hypothetical protein AAF251_06305 [Pseudomonadota bacterium]
MSRLSILRIACLKPDHAIKATAIPATEILAAVALVAEGQPVAVQVVAAPVVEVQVMVAPVVEVQVMAAPVAEVQVMVAPVMVAPVVAGLLHGGRFLGPGQALLQIQVVMMNLMVPMSRSIPLSLISMVVVSPCLPPTMRRFFSISQRMVLLSGLAG